MDKITYGQMLLELPSEVKEALDKMRFHIATRTAYEDALEAYRAFSWPHEAEVLAKASIAYIDSTQTYSDGYHIFRVWATLENSPEAQEIKRLHTFMRDECARRNEFMEAYENQAFSS